MVLSAAIDPKETRALAVEVSITDTFLNLFFIAKDLKKKKRYPKLGLEAGWEKTEGVEDLIGLFDGWESTSKRRFAWKCFNNF